MFHVWENRLLIFKIVAICYIKSQFLDAAETWWSNWKKFIKGMEFFIFPKLGDPCEPVNANDFAQKCFIENLRTPKHFQASPTPVVLLFVVSPTYVVFDEELESF